VECGTGSGILGEGLAAGDGNVVVNVVFETKSLKMEMKLVMRLGRISLVENLAKGH